MNFAAMYLPSVLVVFVLSVGGCYAHFQRKFTSIADEHRIMDSLVAIFLMGVLSFYSLIGLLAIFLMSEGFKYGWLLPFTRSKRVDF